MSLLLDALKRAEQEKLARGERSPAANESQPAAQPGGDTLTLTPLGGVAANNAAGVRADPQGQAQALFQAKQPSALQPKKRTGLWIGITAVVLLALAGGAYVWSAMNALAPKPLVARAPLPPPVAAATTTVAAKGTVAPASTMAPNAPAEIATVTPPAAAGTPSSPVPVTTPPAPAISKREAAMLDVLAEARKAPPRAVAAPTMTRSPETTRVPAAVASGYQALSSGDYVVARRDYESALRSDARNIDALLGLAAVEGRTGQAASAASLYRRALEVDPRNGTAFAGLAALTGYARADALEPQLREDLVHQPGNALMHFALGNLLASQNRWNDAQAAYFEAYRLDPASADITFNLAISLDRIGKSRLAADFYKRALEARGPSQFDRAQLTRRLAELEAAR